MSTFMVTFHSSIVKFVFALNLLLSKPQHRHLLAFLHGIILCEGRVNISQIRRSSNHDRDLSCMTRFLQESPWNPQYVTKQRLSYLMETIRQTRAKWGDTRPITFLILDDTQCKKERSTVKMEGLDFHYSHSEGKSVWSHSLVTAHVVTDDLSVAWDFRSYFRKEDCKERNVPFKSKNDLAIELLETYSSSPDEHVYVLIDSWYTSKKLIDACTKKGFHVIGAFRSNRMIAPFGMKIKTSTFASTILRPTDLCPVTVDGQTYKVYAYEGPLSNMENVRVFLSWEDKFDPKKLPFCLLCTDTSLDVVTVLRHYAVRWQIEVGYRYFKELLGFDQYQHLSHKGIERFWTIQFLAYTFLALEQAKGKRHSPSLTLGDVVRRIRKDCMGQLILYAYEQGWAQKPLVEVLKNLRLSS
jgi:SRSO17 transposase